jgi:glycosyltransferase involved in cell wall biosynthesis
MQGELKILNLYHSLIYSRIKRKKVIFWTHGYHRKKLNTLFRRIMKLADAVILYTPYVIDYPEHKTFYANNSLYFSEREVSLRNSLIRNKKLRKRELGVAGKNVAVFCGRFYREKKVDLIIKMFQKLEGFHLFAIGDGEDFPKIKNLVKNNNINNVTLLGEIRDFEKKSKYFSAADFGVLTGLIGLNIVDYFFWGLPLIGLAGKHSPEIYYLKDKINGFICRSIEEMRERAVGLVSSGKLPEMSKNAIKTFNTEADHKKMIKGFIDAIKYVA